MTPFEGKAIRIAGVQLQELHVRLAAPSASIASKISLVTDAMEPVALSIFSAISPETIAKIHEATSAVEQDFIRFLALREQDLNEEELSEDILGSGFPPR